MADGNLDLLLGAYSAPVQATARRLREVVGEEVPSLTESVDRPDHLLAYGWSESMRDLLFAIVLHTGHVNLQLADGAQLADASEILEGTGKRSRHVKCRSVEDSERSAVRELIRAQAAKRPPSEA